MPSTCLGSPPTEGWRVGISAYRRACLLRTDNSYQYLQAGNMLKHFQQPPIETSRVVVEFSVCNALCRCFGVNLGRFESSKALDAQHARHVYSCNPGGSIGAGQCKLKMHSCVK